MKYLSQMSLSSTIRTIPSQHLFTAKKRSLGFTLNGTPLHHVSIRLISSAHFLIVVSVHQKLYYSLPLMMIRGIFCHAMVTPRESLLITRMMFLTDTVTERRIPSPRSPKKKSSSFSLTWVCRVKLSHSNSN